MGSALASWLVLGQAASAPSELWFLHLQHHMETGAFAMRVVAHHALLGHHGVKKIRWKECENELWPCKRLLLRSSLAAHPSVSDPVRHRG